MKLVAVDDEPLVLDVLVKAIRKAEAGCEVQGLCVPATPWPLSRTACGQMRHS